MLPSNPACSASNHLSLSNGVGAEQCTCVPEYDTIKKSADLEEEDPCFDPASDARVVSLNGEESSLRKPFGIREPREGGFHADAPTIRISD